jgi:hypothetical protein
MAKAKKTTKKQKEEEIEQTVELSTTDIPAIVQKTIEDCEWCFQFDEDEPQIFAWTDPDLENNENPKVIFEISNKENSYINFTNIANNKTFKLFAREISEKGKEMRERQREAFKNLEDGSENKETNA